MTTTTAQIDVLLHPDELERALRDDVEQGLTSVPKEIPPKWFYDERGSLLFDEITRLDEYYPTRCERSILDRRANEIAECAQADALVELGSGTSAKTRLLLRAMCERGTLRRFVPFDVSEQILRDAAGRINAEFAELEVHGVVGDFERHLGAIPDHGTRLIAFLGGTIGNFPPAERAKFLAQLGDTMHSGDFLLIGFDLVKDVTRLEAAYNDSRGVTADFNRNVLLVINRELGANFDVERYEHVAFFDRDEEWIEMRLRSRGAQAVDVKGLALRATFADGEEMLTEISAKFRRDGIAAELCTAGLEIDRWWTDPEGDFALVLARYS